ncbi:MAG: hypothetical protein PF574_04340 [Candidatus Delongbacteria bacterium]|jgi:hypothetical protein|nr:hypothetical protein [Candidatus Delongbacteria bacterium]
MLKRMFLLIPLLLALLLFSKSKTNDSDAGNRINPPSNKPIKIENTIELNKSVRANYKPYQDSTTYKEVQYAKKLYNSGDYIKAKSILSMLKKDKNKALSEKAHYLCLKWYNSLFIPIDVMEDTKYVVDTKELDKFKNDFPNSKYIEELEYIYENDLKTFNSNVNNPQNLNKINLNKSSSVRLKSDSTYTCSFHNKYLSQDKEEHDLIIKISGKINKYEPMGYMNDKWESKGLLIDDDSTISIKIDNEEKIVLKDYVEFKQQPQYEIREVDNYGSKIDKRFVRDTNAENVTQLATYLTDDLIIPNLKVQLIYGKMGELVPEDGINNNIDLSTIFKSECIVEFRMDEFKR